MPAEAEWQNKTAAAIITSILVEDPLIVGGLTYMDTVFEYSWTATNIEKISFMISALAGHQRMRKNGRFCSRRKERHCWRTKNL
jgi:hypothetical protein